MKRKPLLLLLMIVWACHGFAQTRSFHFQGYAYDVDGQALGNAGITAKFTIYDKNQPSVYYEEEQAFTTDASGVFVANVGEGSTFNNLNFAARDFWLKVEVKKTSGSSYTTLSDARFNAVPYAKSAENGNPVGSIIPFAGSSVPSGWLLCNGSAVNRTDYHDLFDVIGTNFGSGNGTTTFNLPDLRGKTAAGIDASNSNFNLLGKTGGAKTHTLTMAQMRSHNHGSGTLATSSDGGHSHTIRPYSASGVTGSDCTSNCNDRVLYNSDGELMVNGFRNTSSQGGHTHTISGNTANTGGGSNFNILQPYLTVNFIIRVY